MTAHATHPPRPSLRPPRLRPLAAIAALSLAVAAPAWAATAEQSLLFSSGTQSLWGPDGSAAFGASGYAVGNHSLGISYSLSASTGTVDSQVGARLAADFTDTIAWDQRSAVQVGFDFLGNPSASRFSTDLGAHASVSAHLNLNLLGVPIGWNPALMDVDYRLDIDRSFTAALPQSVTGSDAFTPASIGVGLPTFGIGLAGGAGVDLDVRQNAQFQLDGLSGLVQARHRDSGTTVLQALTLNSAAEQWLSFDLGSAGTWDFSYLDLSLANRFTTQFVMDMLAYVEYGVGIYCGDLGTDSDNIACTDDRVRANLAGVSLFNSPEIRLAFGPLDTGTAFSVEVLAAPVPEPASLLLMLAGSGALLMHRRRRLPLRDGPLRLDQAS
ncbi:MAG: PEP-CTERM sorting domain-containing protein [Burkholderiaceae bacterium]|nr:PEP-CTERM sorting domain-containing protein [Rhodoferax sp.]MCP5284841.1 PEP-CTERM sorting domain-containing protein [Burkholderiaceae bacterium]